MTSETKADSAKDNVKKKDEKSKEKEAPPSKVVLRRLPPSMTAETLLEQLSPVPDYNYFYFCPADKSLGHAAFSRAYINFLHHEDLYVFTEKFDNYVFLDDNGGEFPAMVEYAPYQKIPKKRSKRNDTRKGTLEKDPDYMKFLETYQNPQKPQNSFTPEMVLEEIEARDKELKANHGVLKVSTPLLDFVKKKQEEKKQARDKYRDERKKRDDERRRKKEEERKRKKERDRERQMEKERERKRDRDKNREQDGEGKGEPMKMLIKQNEEKGKSKKDEGKYSQRDKQRPAGKDTRSKDKTEKDGERAERERKRREREDEEERKWRERERDRREKREKERKERERKERDRRDKERKEKERKQREAQKEQNAEEGRPIKSESSSKVDIRSIVKVDVMKDSTSSLDEQPSGSENPEKGESRGQRYKARYKDRPERQIYNPGQRAAERRKQMEARKESTPEPREDRGEGGNRGQGRNRGRKDRGGDGQEEGKRE